MSSTPNKQSAKFLIQHYVDGWRKNDLTLILSSLSEDCTIIESPMAQPIQEQGRKEMV